MLTLKSNGYKIEDLDLLGRCVSKSLAYLYDSNGCTSMGVHCSTCSSKLVCEDLNSLNRHLVSKIDSLGFPW